MDNRGNLREFLIGRRARITPEQAKLPAWGGNRRVAGLRREEVAMLAGVSVDYYIKLERGIIGAVSEGVLNAVARALQFTPAERDHLFHLAGVTATIRPGGTRSTPYVARPAVRRVIDAIVDAPAFVTTQTGDVLAANALGRATYSPLYDGEETATPNTARFLFLNPRAREFFPEWEDNAADAVASLRAHQGRNPHDERVSHLIDDLNRDSKEFRTLWRAHDVRYHDTGYKRLHHPVVGDLTLTYEVLELPADPGQSLVVYGAEPGSPTADALRLLASWTAEHTHADTHD
ncbi:transcriptional regulator with XRE-family HTH domain [Kibdelosporangium banguiense]|uniref:Transcriptional regulator with XRE-family HTH domain n=1 Tax=Kibdelosporangium banguiense TaxID=1365924 RepID=A0ABS4TYK5_9PSEU|nr:helix-turn-helix transcriptional regulator [Kibdelosporangium banguiense]MBP2329467.1 transcriptional regulator with XRE-family HTH domain [Kibdelosporangium banguiense]